MPSTCKLIHTIHLAAVRKANFVAVSKNTVYDTRGIKKKTLSCIYLLCNFAFMIQDRVIKVFFSKGCVNIFQQFRIAKYNLCLEDIMNFNTFCFFVFLFFFVFQCGIRFEITFQFFLYVSNSTNIFFRRCAA